MLSLIAVLVVLGVIFYFIQMIPMADPMPQIIRAVLVIAAILIVLNAFGVHLFPNLQIGRIG